MKLVACPDCHAQYDVTDVAAEQLRVPLRQRSLENRALRAVDAEISRCASCGAQVGETAAELRLLRRRDRARARRRSR